MKIWLPTLRTGTGTDVFTRRLTDGLNEQGIEAHISWFPLRYEFAPWLLRRVRPPPGTTIIHANSWHAIGFVRHGLPLVVTVHHGTSSTLNWRQRFYHRLLIRVYEKIGLNAASRIVVVSPSTEDWLLKAHTIPPHKILTILNGIDTTTFSPTAPPSSPPPFRLLFVGKPSYRKGADRLATIMKNLGADFELYCATGHHRLAHPPPGSVDVGWLEDDAALADLYRSAHALLAPSRLEGFGLAVVEASACGLPVVAADAPGLRDTVHHHETGYLVPGDDIEAYVQAIRALARDEALRTRMGENGRRWVCSRFTRQAMIHRHIDLYRKLSA